MSEPYVSAPCQTGNHSECVTGFNVFNMREEVHCRCSCHDAEMDRIARALAGGLTQRELKMLWYRERGDKVTF